MPVSNYWTTAVLLALALAGSAAQQEVLSPSRIGFYEEYPYHRFNHTVKRVAVIGAGMLCGQAGRRPTMSTRLFVHRSCWSASSSLACRTQLHRAAVRACTWTWWELGVL